ncbi:hypothetical protein V493_03286 [Pseudogymnoascus sp. VKM F-4281 (FW-2241)]|nr:hypothetical protein V493_03286 [Pseudogymnoascus sp. VKM F-4281 (FW-2241)]
MKNAEMASTDASLSGDTANPNPLSLEDQITLQLAQKLSATEPSLLGHSYPADHYLPVILESFDCIIEQARVSLQEDRTVALSSVVERAAEVTQEREDGDIGQESAAAQTAALDQATLLLCIALLDHALYKDIYDSIIVGFLAVLGIRKDGCFSEATTYTLYLSAFIKIAQLLVIQRSVLAVKLDEVDHVADILDVMQDRFMVYRTRSPMNWVQKLRTYGKKIQDTTTSLGHIIWTDDSEQLTYKDFQVTMTNLKTFVAKQVSIAQQQLHDLLLVHEDEDRGVVAPRFNLRSLKDDPSISELGWNFLKHAENSTLHGHEDWLLTRVSAKWKKQVVHRYLKQVDSFLESLLLLVHITGGQPARGSELTSLQFCNSTHGIRRSVFIENGLVSFVTFYHKGYSIQGSTKIVHRYLPREVTLDMSLQSISTPFLWCSEIKDNCIIPWPSSRLSDVIGLIAITRRHLKQGKFKKDYDLGQTLTWADKQSCYTTLVAGAVYACGIEEAPGHVESARAEYRQISQEWHSWLGFALYLGSWAGALETLGPAVAKAGPSTGDASTHKRKALRELSNAPLKRQRRADLSRLKLTSPTSATAPTATSTPASSFAPFPATPPPPLAAAPTAQCLCAHHKVEAVPHYLGPPPLLRTLTIIYSVSKKSRNQTAYYRGRSARFLPLSLASLGNPEFGLVIEILPPLAHLIHLNVEFKVLVCLGRGCHKAVSRAGLVEHLRKIHKEKPEIRKQVEEYTKKFPFDYNYSTIQLPVDGLAPQPIILIVNGLQCQYCQYRTQNRSNIKKHGNKEHGKKRVHDHELFTTVVDESRQTREAQQVHELVCDVGEQSNDNVNEEEQASSQDDDADDQIVHEIEQWKEAAQERRLTLLAKPAADELDPWLRYTRWNEVLQESQVDII